MKAFLLLTRSKYCSRDVSRNFHVICAEPICMNAKGGVRLCGDCLHLSIATHTPLHSYTVADCMQIPIFSKDWTIAEELVLLAGEYDYDLRAIVFRLVLLGVYLLGIEKHGMGNWKTIGESMGLGRTAKQIEEHYFEKYMGVHGYCLPAKTVLHNKQNSNLTGVGGKLQFVDTEATFFSRPARDVSKLDGSRSTATSSIPTASNEEPAVTEDENDQSDVVEMEEKLAETGVALDVDVISDQRVDEPVLSEADAVTEEMPAPDQPDEAAPEEGQSTELNSFEDSDELPIGVVVSGQNTLI